MTQAASTETATRGIGGVDHRANLISFMANVGVLPPRLCADMVDAYAAAVREEIAQRIDACAAQWSGTARRFADGVEHAARLARGES